MAIEVVLAKAHQNQIELEDVQKEVASINSAINRANIPYKNGTINCVFLKGMYSHIERKMMVALLFVNKTEAPVTGIRGVLRMEFKDRSAIFAKTTLTFNKDFLGVLDSDKALYVRLHIPVKGLKRDGIFTASDIQGSFDDVKISVENDAADTEQAES